MKVLPLTLGVHVKEIYWGRMDNNFYFYPSESCDVAYFRKSDIKTRMGIKEKDLSPCATATGLSRIC